MFCFVFCLFACLFVCLFFVGGGMKFQMETESTVWLFIDILWLLQHTPLPTYV